MEKQKTAVGSAKRVAKSFLKTAEGGLGNSAPSIAKTKTPDSGPKKATTAVAVKTVDSGTSLATTTAETGVKLMLVTIAEQLSRPDVAPLELARISGSLANLTKVLADLQAAAKDRIKKLVMANGTKATDAGTKRLEQDGYVFEVRPNGTGYDGGKFEALLRAKGIDPTPYMTTNMSLSFNLEGAADAVAKGKMTKAELDSCKKEGGWSVMTPKAVQDE